MPVYAALNEPREQWRCGLSFSGSRFHALVNLDGRVAAESKHKTEGILWNCRPAPNEERAAARRNAWLAGVV
jgi:hypothetical protein